jgi:hypothetical protein
VVRIKTQCNLCNAEIYFEEQLQLGDYYSQENQVLGEWFGTGAEWLGLTGIFKETDFLKLCRNEYQDGDGTLTQRLKTTRRDEDRMTAYVNLASRQGRVRTAFSSAWFNPCIKSSWRLRA